MQTGNDVTLTLTNLAAGEYPVSVMFGDDVYDVKYNETSFTVAKADPVFDIAADDVVYGTNVTVVPSTVANAGVVGYAILDKDGVVVASGPEDIADNFTAKLPAGTYTVIASFRNANYTDDVAVRTVNVNKAGSNITIDVESIYKVGDDIVIRLTTENITDSDAISVTINGEAFKVVNNEVTITGGLAAGKYIINAVLAGNENYTTSSANRSFEVIKNNITIDLTATSPIYAVNPVNFTATLGEKVTGDVIFTINGASYTVHVSDDNKAIYEYTPVNNETLTVVATFAGNDEYNSNSTTRSFDVERVSTNIDVTVKEPVTYGEDAVISIELDAPVNNTVKLTVDGKEYNVPLTDGKGGFNASGLTAGPHEVNVTFAGDNKYVESNDTATFTIDKADLTADVIALNVTVEENTMFVIDVPDDYNGNVSITVDGKVLYNDTAKIIIDADKLTAGDKTADVVFYGDDNYGELTLDDIEFTVSRVVPEIAVDIDAVTYPDKAVAVINVANKANGTVNITVDGKVFKGEIKNGEGSVDLTGLSAGAKVADVKFFTSDDYNDNATSTAKFNINKANSTITITVEPEYVYNDTITIDLDPSFDGVVNVTVNGVIYPVNNNQVVIDRIAAGDYTIIANLAESQNYTGATNSTTFKVKQAESNITIEVESIYKVGDDIVIRLTTENITDSDAISVTINGESYKVVDNEVIITGGLDAGKYIINAVLAGNENYTTSSANKSFEVIKLNTTIFIYATTPREVGSPFDIGAVLGHSVTGDVVFTINGTNYTVKIVDDWIAVIEYTPVNNDTVNVVATFMGDDKYNSISTTGSFDVDKVDTEIEVTVKQPVTYGEDAAISIELDAPINTTVKLTVDGTDYNVGLINGKGSYNVSGLNAGPHEVNVTYAGDAKYIESNNSTTFTIEKADLTADVTGLDVTVEQNTSFVIDIIKDFNGNVSITVDGEELYNGPANTIVEGIKLSAGDKTADVVFYGDSNYDELTIDNVEFTVSRVTPEILVEIDNVDYPNNTTATIAVSNNANGTVEITVDGKKYKGEIKNGEGTVELTDLTAGAKVAEVEFISGDDYNDNANTNAKFTVNKADTPISLEVEEGLVGELTNITVGLDAPGIVSVKVNDTIVYVGPVNDGSIVIPVSDLTKGDYEVIVDYYGDENYKPNSTSSSFTVDKNSTYNFDATPTVENQTLIIDIDLPDDATGNITVNVDGENITVPVNDTISLDLDPGNHTVNVTYNGDDKYEPKSKDLGEITIPKVDDYPINATVVDDELIVSVPEDATGNVTITIGEDDYVVPIEDGKAVLDISGLDPGDYVADVTYPGDDKYGPNSNSTEFTIPKVDDYPINATVVDDELIVSVPEDATGNVKVNIGDKDYTVPIKDGKAVLDISGLDPGDYVADVTYPGDDKYGPNSNSTKFTVPKIDNYPMNMTNTDDELVVSVPEDATGNVKVNIDGKDYTVPIKDGKAVLDISDLPSGEHDVIVTYPGNDKYAPKTIKGVINTTVSLIITAPDVVKYYSGPERFIVYCTDDKGNNVDGLTINITIHGVTYTRTTSDGKASIALTLNSGNYIALVEFGGKDKFKPQTLNATVEILPTIYAKDVFKVFRNGTQYYALFTDGEGNPLPNINVTFNIHGVFYTRTTNSTGWAKLNINLLQGKYIITAFNPVTGEYRSNNVTVFTLIVASDLTKYFRNESQFIVRVRGPDGNWAKAGEKVTFNIHGVFYTRYTNETGHIKLNIGLEYGDYIVTTYYKDAVEANHIKVLPRLIVSDFVMTYGDGSEFVAKTLDGQGNIAPYQKVSFNVFGVLYDRITDGNGETRLKIPLPPGEYLMTSVYMEEIHANKVTIKG
ncbi:Ig-like domain repeat protein [Methanobrevibacter sp.]|uniref:Ig-like domain repeat protein n=1 Tax=Methanobrevibacter sp. TaxID=66852 RepID=UPI00388DF1A6